MRAIDFPRFATSPIRPHRAITVGGGNVAMDSARTALRLGGESTIVYRRSKAEMPARAEEVHHAEEEGVVFHLLTNPVRIITDAQNGSPAWNVCGWNWASPMPRAGGGR
jgi:glutamate synthase (NADPH) small chain